MAQQAVEARLLDAHIGLKADATQTALEEVKKKTDAVRKAEDETRQATNNVQKAEADLKEAAARLEAEARGTETTAQQKKQQAQQDPADELQQAANTPKAPAERPETDRNVADLRKAEQNALAASSKARDEETAASVAWEKARRGRTSPTIWPTRTIRRPMGMLSGRLNGDPACRANGLGSCFLKFAMTSRGVTTCRCL